MWMATIWTGSIAKSGDSTPSSVQSRHPVFSPVSGARDQGSEACIVPAQEDADDVAVVVLHLLPSPPPAHAGRPTHVPPAATSCAAANAPAYLSASRAAMDRTRTRPAVADDALGPVHLAAARTASAAAPELLRTSLGRPGKPPVGGVQDPSAPRRERPLTVVTQRRVSDAVAADPPTLQSAFAGAAVNFRTDSAYTHDLRHGFHCLELAMPCQRQIRSEQWVL